MTETSIASNGAPPDFRFPLRQVLIVLSVWAVLFVFLFDGAAEAFSRHWVIIPISFFAAAFANATAIGGGFLFVPLFIFGYGLLPIVALKLSLATQAFGMTSGALGWSRRYIVTRALIVGGIASVIGMYVGTYEIAISGALIKKSFGWISMFIFAVIVLEIKFGNLSRNRSMVNDTAIKAGFFAILCFAGGVITAWTAIGIGEVVALYLLFVYRIRIEAAVGTGVAVLAICSIAGFGFHSQLGGIPWEFLAFTIPGVILGGRFGARFGILIESSIQNRGANSDSGGGARSPLKCLIAFVVFADGLMMLLQSYIF